MAFKKPPGQIWLLDQVSGAVRTKVDAVLRSIHRKRRCRRCYFWNPGDGSAPALGLCSKAPPTVIMRTQAMWSKGVSPEEDDESEWVGLKNTPESVLPQVHAEGYCRDFVRHRLVTGWFGMSG